MSDQPENQSSNPDHDGIPSENQTAATPTTDKPKRTAEQEVILDRIARVNAREWAERHADRIIWEAENF